MAGDELQILQGLVHEGGRSLGDVAMRGAVGAVLADGVLLVQLVGQRVHVGLRRNGLEERGVEDGHHGLAGHLLAAGLDAHERGLVVQRRELRQLVDLGNDIVIDEHGAIEVLAALHYAVPHGVDVVQRVDGLGGAARQRLQHEGHGGVVIGHGGVDDHLILVDAVLVEGLGGTDTLADALGEHFMGFNIDELVLQRGRTGVEDEDVQ